VPELDPDHPEFDPVAVAHFTTRDPWTLEFGVEEPPPLESFIDVEQAALRVRLAELQELLPSESADYGEHIALFDVGVGFDLGRDYGVLRLDLLRGFLIQESSIVLDDALARVLSGDESTVGGRTYAFGGSALGQVGISTGLTYAREIKLQGEPVLTAEGSDWLDEVWDGERRRPRLWLGAGLRRVSGLAYARLDSDVGLVAEDPQPGRDDSFGAQYESSYTSASPKNLGDLGGGWAVDLGAVLRWADWEFGVGASDLFAEIEWKNSRRDRFYYDPSTNAIAREPLEQDRQIRTELPTRWLIDLVRRTDGTLWTADFGGGPGGLSAHAGIEHWWREPIALRTGLEIDPRGDLQGGVGFGIRRRGLGFDLGLKTNGRNLNGERRLSLGLALVLR
jgi:hypothetical protein